MINFCCSRTNDEQQDSKVELGLEGGGWRGGRGVSLGGSRPKRQPENKVGLSATSCGEPISHRCQGINAGQVHTIRYCTGCDLTMRSHVLSTTPSPLLLRPLGVDSLVVGLPLICIQDMQLRNTRNRKEVNEHV